MPMQSTTWIELRVLGMLRFTLFGVLEVEMSRFEPTEQKWSQVSDSQHAGHFQFAFKESRHPKTTLFS